MIATTAQAATTEVVYVIPLGWTVALGAVIFLAAGALVGAWLTSEATRADVEDRIDRGIRSGVSGALADRPREIPPVDDDNLALLAILVDRLGGDVEIGLRELEEVDRDRVIYAYQTLDGVRVAVPERSSR